MSGTKNTLDEIYIRLDTAEGNSELNDRARETIQNEVQEDKMK